MLIPSINNSLNELINLLNQLSETEYSNSCAELSNASIGEHTRHIIEMFQCLENQYDLGIVNYDKRERNVLIQNDANFAIQHILTIQNDLEKQNKNIELQQIIDGEEIRIQSNYYRELLYNLEHCIHHQALIKVAILQCENVIVDENFGVARSTIEYRNQCAQ
ncbi:DinB family protein [Flavobacterium gawalongense]|uniref:DinB family protein n=1 Tax=Flavobacterium gawalongense TaxID=2594432 RepID=A0A553BYK7_9FLAO|nr:DinB family protein [Flavobacterium gawalongense]TRX01129.1 DinB family protein [Flavobacterium gawalongense]TRX05634.1 DinB family protein [Flavobacterium gawalongense]TRX13295.1 DinB family protein [Flavobacterium gawalongense]TRX15773.1 DinB family protein [Flavobacterium gawalongense]TRX31611.1 DinB family protein [Flavobacterium gawalongense]